MRWEQGRPAIDGMLGRGEVERVRPSRDHAELLLGQARTHVIAAKLIASIDPIGGYQLLYDAARKALTAVLENQGLRPTSRGGHIAVYDAVAAQLEPPLGKTLRPFDRMRRRRNDAEYPRRGERPPLTPENVESDLEKVSQIVEVAAGVIGRMSSY